MKRLGLKEKSERAAFWMSFGEEFANPCPHDFKKIFFLRGGGVGRLILFHFLFAFDWKAGFPQKPTFGVDIILQLKKFWEMSGKIEGDSVSNSASQKHLGNISAGCGEQGKRGGGATHLCQQPSWDPVCCIRGGVPQWEITIPDMMPGKSCHHCLHSYAPHYLALNEY